MIRKIYNWFYNLCIQIQAAKTKNYQFRKCSYCKKRYVFDVPMEIPIIYITFICNKCTGVHEQTITEFSTKDSNGETNQKEDSK